MFFFTDVLSIFKPFLLLAWVINITMLLPSTSLLPSVNQFFIPFHCIVLPPQLASVQIKDLLFSLSCLFFIRYHIYKEARVESTFSTDTFNYIWQLPNLNSFHFATAIYHNKKHASCNLVSFRVSSFLKFALGFRVNQEIPICIIAIYMKSSGNSSEPSQQCPAESHGKILSYLASQPDRNLARENGVSHLERLFIADSTASTADFNMHDFIYKELHLCWTLILLIFWPVSLPHCWFGSSKNIAI